MKKENGVPPPGLLLLQAEFGKSIRTPFSFATGRFQCRKDDFSDMAAGSITTRGARDGRDGLAVYNEQYWYRLLTVLQQDFSLLAAALGLWTFNQLATAFLDRHPSRSPYLQDLPSGFLEFLKASPIHNQPRLVQVADLETAFLRAFHAPSLPPWNPAGLTSLELERLADSPMVFQPWLSLVEEDWNLMECRTDLVEKRSVSPLFLERKGYWAVFRNGIGVEWRELEPLQFNLLIRLRSGQPLAAACEALIDRIAPSEAEYLATRMSSWFETWTLLQWFGQPSPEGLVEGHAEMV